LILASIAGSVVLVASGRLRARPCLVAARLSAAAPSANLLVPALLVHTKGADTNAQLAADRM
jgi:hypothetical protein